MPGTARGGATLRAAPRRAPAPGTTGRQHAHSPSRKIGSLARRRNDRVWRTVDGVKLMSERLVLLPAGERDLDFYFELRNRPEILALPGRESKTRSEVERQLHLWVERWQGQVLGTWTVFDRKTDERLGRVELDPIGPGWAGVSPGEIEVGCIVHPTHWNQGIATEATRLATEDCFSRVGLVRLVALTTTANLASLRALEKIGMRHCGATQHEDDPTTYELFELTQPAPQP